ncbi:methyl-accepting chemotaxis protein [Marinospirillum sp. MEB164]|uniref:Methyl-accepting chemotaxis protein n=1 Tax=Marinospirillum alkalitolerans TaxID=3123374 RepID=A0ABW8PW10_9GAMM
MRVNQPITEQERLVSPQDQLITITDLRGIITDANQAFAEISGYTQQELIGQNHNLIRHPHMPEAAFEDLWKTIQSGRSWKGLVKNRCKNGDFYWVDAYVTPIKKDGKIVEYQSVRRAAPRALIARAEGIYARWSNSPRPQQPIRLSLRQQLFLCTFLITALGSGLAFWQLGGSASLVLAGSGLLLLGGLHWLTQGLKALEQQARQINDHPFMTWLYTGRQDELGRIEFALATRTSELLAVVARLHSNAALVRHKKANSDAQLQAALDHVEHQGSLIEEARQALQTQQASLAEVAEGTAKTTQSVAQSHQATQVGQASIHAVTEAIMHQAQELNLAKDQVAELAETSQEIEQVMEVISQVAEQTNLLALNAAIEAARAGEAGRGFAVVADEVRALAQRTHQSTLEVNRIVEELQTATQASVSAITQGVHTSSQTVSLADQMRQGFAEILQAVDQMRDFAALVNQMTQEQAALSEQTTEQMGALAHLAEQSVAAGQAARQEADDLDDQVAHLHLLASHFIDSLQAQAAATQVRSA